MGAFIDPPKRIPFYLQFGIWITKRVTGQELLPAKLGPIHSYLMAINSAVLKALDRPRTPIASLQSCRVHENGLALAGQVAGLVS